ncbi:MAG: hypothetical protein AAGJ91_17985 [Pseudomonadota bacterium]
MDAHHLDDHFLDRVARNLSIVPLSPRGLLEGPVRVREIEGYDLAFLVARRPEAMVITIVRIWPKGERSMQMRVMQALGVIALFRDASGV